MPRALAVGRVSIPAADRDGYLAEARRRRDAVRAAGCNCWLFEDPDRPGSFTEFVEAGDPGTVAEALRRAGLPASPILREVELP